MVRREWKGERLLRGSPIITDHPFCRSSRTNSTSRRLSSGYWSTPHSQILGLRRWMLAICSSENLRVYFERMLTVVIRLLAAFNVEGM